MIVSSLRQNLRRAVVDTIRAEVSARPGTGLGVAVRALNSYRVIRHKARKADRAARLVDIRTRAAERMIDRVIRESDRRVAAAIDVFSPEVSDRDLSIVVSHGVPSRAHYARIRLQSRARVAARRQSVSEILDRAQGAAASGAVLGLLLTGIGALAGLAQYLEGAR